MFGPLLAMRAGHNHSVRLQNELTAPVNDDLVGSCHRRVQHACTLEACVAVVMPKGCCVRMQGATHFNSFKYPTHTNLHAHGMKLVPLLLPMPGSLSME